MQKPTFTVSREPDTRFVAEWTPGAVRGAISAMASGRFAQAGRLADALLGDDRVSAVLGTRVNGVTGLPLTFKAAVEENARAAQVAEALEADWWSMLPEQSLAELHTYGLLCGVALAQLNWIDKDGRVIPQVEVWHPSHLTLKDGRWLVTDKDNREIEVTPGDGQWLLYTPFGSRRAWTRSLIRALSIPWLSKQFAIRDWNRYSEVLGGTIRKGRVPTAAKPEDKDEFRRDLRNLGADSVVVTPEGFDVELLEASGTSSDSFHELIDWADKAIAIAVLGQNLTTDVEGGSHAAATVHDSVRNDLVESDVQALSTHANHQLISWWAEFNFGDRTLAPWPDWLTTPAKKNGELYQYHLMAPVVTANEVRDQLGLPPLPPERGGDEFVVISQGPVATGLLSRAEHGVALASGDDPHNAAGFIRGQLYTDALAEQTGISTAQHVQPYVQRIAEAVSSARDYPELRERLTELFAGADPTEFANLTERALILAGLAGRLAEYEDER